MSASGRHRSISVVVLDALLGAPEPWLRLVRRHAPRLLPPSSLPAKVLSSVAAAAVRAAPASPAVQPTGTLATAAAPQVSTQDSAPTATLRQRPVLLRWPDLPDAARAAWHDTRATVTALPAGSVACGQPAP